MCSKIMQEKFKKLILLIFYYIFFYNIFKIYIKCHVGPLFTIGFRI